MVDEIAIPTLSTVDFPNKKPSDDPVIPGQPAPQLGSCLKAHQQRGGVRPARAGPAIGGNT